MHQQGDAESNQRAGLLRRIAHLAVALPGYIALVIVFYYLVTVQWVIDAILAAVRLAVGYIDPKEKNSNKVK